MEKRCCRNCVYGKKPEDRWLRIALAQWPGMLICSVCADRPGRTCGVYAGACCRNFCPKPGVVCGPREPLVEPGEKLCKIPLSQGLSALVDPEDYEELNKHKWCAVRYDNLFYAVRAGPDGKAILMHREIMKTPPDMVVDHKNLDGLDNRKINMRNATRAQNSYNHRPPCGGTGFKGVKYVAQTGKYKATVGYKRRAVPVGEFDDPIEAAKARDRVAWELHGEFAYLNFPEEFTQKIEAGASQPGDSTRPDADAEPGARTPPRCVLLKGTAVVHIRVRGELSVAQVRPSGRAGGPVS